MKSFFSRTAFVTIFSLLAALVLSIICFSHDTPALAGSTQLPDLGKEEQKRLKEEAKRLKKEEELKRKAEEQLRKQEAKISKGSGAAPSPRGDGLDIAIL